MRGHFSKTDAVTALNNKAHINQINKKRCRLDRNVAFFNITKEILQSNSHLTFYQKFRQLVAF